MLANVNLPTVVSEGEDLGRIICDSGDPKKYEKTAFKYNSAEGRYEVNTSKFIDTRYPSILSVNRISTISHNKAHELGKQHRKERQPTSTYHGFAKIKAKICFNNRCRVEKDDDGGRKPYHANIIYPYDQIAKEDKQEIAIQLAYYAEFIRDDLQS